MEVTQEMIEAVYAHHKAEAVRKATEARDERFRTYQEAQVRIMAEALENAKKIIPDLTKKQFDELLGVFYDYSEAQENT